MTEEERKSIFKKQSIVLIIVQMILIISTLILYIVRDTEIALLPTFSMEKLFIMVFICTLLFAVLISGLLLNGVFKYNMISTNFIKKIVNKINYKIILEFVLIIVIIGVICFFIDLTLVKGDLLELTWGGIISGIGGLIILGLILLIGILLIINEIEVVS
ncbi:MAG: hypothetical protein ACFFBP_12160 [Promethearchaeota archaeon]